MLPLCYYFHLHVKMRGRRKVYAEMCEYRLNTPSYLVYAGLTFLVMHRWCRSRPKPHEKVLGIDSRVKYWLYVNHLYVNALNIDSRCDLSSVLIVITNQHSFSMLTQKGWRSNRYWVYISWYALNLQTEFGLGRPPRYTNTYAGTFADPTRCCKHTSCIYTSSSA